MYMTISRMLSADYEEFYNYSDINSLLVSPVMNFTYSSCQDKGAGDDARKIIAYAPDDEITRVVIQQLKNIGIIQI